MGERSSLCERIRNARANLTNAEQSFQAKQDVRGELDLMLAEAEMQNLRKRRTKRMLWTRQLLAGLCAVLVLLGGYGGWLWAQTREKEVPGVPALAAVPGQPVSKALETQTTAMGQAANAPPAGTTPPVAAPQAAAASKVTDTAVVESPVQQPVAAPVRQAGPAVSRQAEPVVSRQAQTQLSSQQMHQLVRTGRQTLNSSK
jgi:hypothetical protein